MTKRAKGITALRRVEGTSEAPPAVPSARPSMVVPVGTGERAATTGATVSVSEALVDTLAGLGVEHAYALFGGGIAPFCEALARSPIRLMHFRHEAGAAFAAIESSLASGRLAVVVATTGPGLTNLFTGMVAARLEGARVLFISGGTPPAQRGRGAFQETSGTSGTMASLFSSNGLFHHTAVLEDAAGLEVTLARLASGLLRPNGFVAHLCLPLSVQAARLAAPKPPRIESVAPLASPTSSVKRCAELLSSAPFVIWAGFGARRAAESVRVLAERTGSMVMCSPRAKGVMPEHHPLYLGVTGLGGHESVETYLRRAKPERTLVLGSRLGEFTSFWSPEFAPPQGFVHVDLDSDVFGAAYPSVPTLGVQSDVATFLDELLVHWPTKAKKLAEQTHGAAPVLRAPRPSGSVRPSFLMAAIQEVVVKKSEGIVLTEAGNSFALGTHHLRFDTAGRYRVSTAFGSMGHAVTGVLGAALGSHHKAFALVGDGAMLMLSEVSSAAQYGIDAVWIVLNDARYGMIAQGMQSIGWEPFETDFPRADFVAIARGMGADGVRVEREADVAAALEAALQARGPFVVDVLIDPSELAPATKRNQSLVDQGVNGKDAR